MNTIKRKKGLHRNIFHIQITHEEIYDLLVYIVSAD